MRPFRTLPESAVKRSGDRILQRLVARTLLIPGGKSGTFTAPEAGEYVVSAWGGGSEGASNTSPGGASGAFCRKRVSLNKGDALSYSAGLGGRPNFYGLRDASPSTVTGPGINLVAGAATRSGSGTYYGTAGVASGGDVNVNGLLPEYGGAPGPSLSHPDGDVLPTAPGNSVNVSSGGSTIKAGSGQTPSAGGGFAAVNGGTGIGGDGGDGMITISYAVPE